MTDHSRMDRESKEYNAKAVKAILNGLLNSVKNNLGKCSSARGIWNKLHDLHSKGALTMTISQEDDGNLEPIMEAEHENDDVKAKEDLEDEENEKDFVEELLTKLMTAMEEINNLKEENEELKKRALVGNQDQTRNEELVKLKNQLKAKDEEIFKLKSNIKLLKAETCKATRIKEEMERS